MLRSITLLILLGFIWGSGYSLARYAMLKGVQPLGYAFWQSWGPAIMLWLLLRLRRHAKLELSWQSVRYYLVTAILGIVIPNTVIYFSACHLPAGILAIVVNTVPIFSYPIALLVAEERADLIRLIGIGFGIIGLLCILLPKANLPTSADIPWVLIALIAPLSFACCAIFSSKYRPANTDSMTLSLGMLLTSAILLTPITLSLGQFYSPLSPTHFVTLVIFLEVMLSSVGYFLFFELLRVAGPVYYSLVGGLVGLTGIFWGIIIFGERLTASFSLAVVFILMAIGLVTIKINAYRRRQ